MNREEAIEILKGAIKKPNTKDGYLGQALTMGIESLENQKTGYWITQGLSPYEGISRCSACYKTYDIRVEFNYCPNCGAKMEGEKE